MNNEFYFSKLYPLQDKVLKIINACKTGFYLTGGTASSRAYLHHRFSDDLDFFVNDDTSFGLWVDRVIHELLEIKNGGLEIIQKDERFCRLLLQEEEIPLKIEMINDVPSHIGKIRTHDILQTS